MLRFPIVVLALLLIPAAAGRAASCRSTRTVIGHGTARLLFHHGSVRAYAAKSGDTPSLLVCGRRASRPIRVASVVGGTIRAQRFRVTGRRLGFVLRTDDMSDNDMTEVGWVDPRSRKVERFVENAGEAFGPGDPELPTAAVSYAIAPDGGMAVIAGDGATPQCQVVAVFPVGGAASVLFTAPAGGLDPGSLAITDAVVSWRDATGAISTAARTGGRPVASEPTGGC